MTYKEAGWDPLSYKLAFMATFSVGVVVLFLGLTALSWLTLAIWPARVERARVFLQQRWGSAVWRGAGLLVASMAWAHLAKGAGRPGLILVPLMFCAVSFLLGLPGLFEMLGERLLEQAERGWDRLRTIALGAGVICAAGLIPWIGQAFWIFLALTAIGAGVSVLRSTPG